MAYEQDPRPKHTPLPEKRADGLTPSSAPNASMDEGGGEVVGGFDSPPEGSISLSNPEINHDYHAEPFYPPGGGLDENESRRD